MFRQIGARAIVLSQNELQFQSNKNRVNPCCPVCHKPLSSDPDRFFFLLLIRNHSMESRELLSAEMSSNEERIIFGFRIVSNPAEINVQAETFRKLMVVER